MSPFLRTGQQLPEEESSEGSDSPSASGYSSSDSSDYNFQEQQGILCREFLYGTCDCAPDECLFKHNLDLELVDMLCRNHIYSTCPYAADECVYLHLHFTDSEENPLVLEDDPWMTFAVLEMVPSGIHRPSFVVRVEPALDVEEEPME